MATLDGIFAGSYAACRCKALGLKDDRQCKNSRTCLVLNSPDCHLPFRVNLPSSAIALGDINSVTYGLW